MELALKLIREAKEQRLTRLDLGNCGLTELPDELFELTWLEELILSRYWRVYYFEKKVDMHFQSQNKGEANNIKSLNSKIKKLKKIKLLIIGNQENFCDLTSLKYLTLSKV